MTIRHDHADLISYPLYLYFFKYSYVLKVPHYLFKFTIPSQQFFLYFSGYCIFFGVCPEAMFNCLVSKCQIWACCWSFLVLFQSSVSNTDFTQLTTTVVSTLLLFNAWFDEVQFATPIFPLSLPFGVSSILVLVQCVQYRSYSTYYNRCKHSPTFQCSADGRQQSGYSYYTV